MFLTEYNEEKMMEKERQEGANLLGKLITELLSLNRTEDVARVAQDEEYRMRLYQEFQLA